MSCHLQLCKRCVGLAHRRPTSSPCRISQLLFSSRSAPTHRWTTVSLGLTGGRSLHTSAAVCESNASAAEVGGKNKPDSNGDAPRRRLYPDSKADKLSKTAKPVLYKHRTRSIPINRRAGPSKPPPIVPLDVDGDLEASAGLADFPGDVQYSAKLREMSLEELSAVIRSEASQAARVEHNGAKQATHLRNTFAACRQLKATLIKTNAPDGSSDKKLVRPERSVYRSLLMLFSKMGAHVNALYVLEDMRKAEQPPGIEELNLALDAAALAGSAQNLYKVLDQIDQSLPDSAPATTNFDVLPLVDLHTARHWTPATFASLIRYCSTCRNLEYALSLLGLAQHFARTSPSPATAHEDNSASATSGLARWIKPSVRTMLIDLCAEVCEPALALDIALLLEEAEENRALAISPRAWMLILRASATEHFVEGAEVAWTRVVEQQGTQAVVPDLGLLEQLLSACARTGSFQLAEKVSKYIQQVYPAAAADWHYTPLFEAYCQAGEWSLAFRYLTTMRKKGVRIGSPESFALSSAIHTRDALDEAIKALEQRGRDRSALGGVEVVAFNGVLHAASLSPLADAAPRLFHHCHRLRRPPDLAAAAIDAAGTDRKAGATKLEYGFQPNLDSYHFVLSGLIKAGDFLQGRSFLRDLNERRGAGSAQGDEPLRANATTYEKAIRLELVSIPETKRLKNALALLEEAKRAGVQPTRQTYEPLLWRALEQQWQAGSGADGALALEGEEQGLGGDTEADEATAARRRAPRDQQRQEAHASPLVLKLLHDMIETAPPNAVPRPDHRILNKVGLGQPGAWDRFARQHLRRSASRDEAGGRVAY